jgi:hypothetical protein
MPLEVLVGAAVGAAAASEKVRKVVRQGVVYGLAGVLVAYDKVAAVGQGALKGARGTVADGQGETAPAAPASAAPAPPTEQT